MKATITERGQVSIPARLRREMHLEPRQTVLWEKMSTTECRLIVLPLEQMAPDPMEALTFARRHHLDEGRSDDVLKELRAGDRDGQTSK